MAAFAADARQRFERFGAGIVAFHHVSFAIEDVNQSVSRDGDGGGQGESSEGSGGIDERPAHAGHGPERERLRLMVERDMIELRSAPTGHLIQQKMIFALRVHSLTS